MPSNYPAIDLVFIESNGARTPVASATVKGWNVPASSDLGTIGTTNSEGVLPAGTLSSVAVGTLVRFRVENHQGRAASVDVVTT